MRTPVLRNVFVTLLVVLMATACGRISGELQGGTATPQFVVVTATPDTSAAAPTPSGATAEPTAPASFGSKGGGAGPTSGPEATSRPGGAVATLSDVKAAVVQIVAQGTFIDPEFGLQMNAAGSGSGFIIDPSGIAVTNNHVATGAAFLKIYMAGETRPRNAKVLGVSECSDLALIDIDGDGFPYLEWFDGAVVPGLEVYTAGFPLGDPEYTLTRGIVSKERADGDSNWASADYVIEHDARLNPGNSGGPLVTKDGQVVGVNYAGIESTGQQFAIGRAEFDRVYETLRSGQDVTSIGVNGVVVQSDDGSVSGIWVASVESGSPADKAGVKGGDIIMQLEGLVLGTDGTMADYCDVLRSRNADATMSITVLRWATGEILEGQLNGRELKVTQTFTTGATGGTSGGATTTPSTTEYMSVWDDDDLITMDVPTSWSQVDGSPWIDDNGNYVGAMIVAGPDAQAFLNTLDVPGVFYVASRVLADEYASPSDLLDDRAFWSSCRNKGGRNEYNDGLYAGVWEEHMGCGKDGKTIVYTIAAEPEEKDLMIWIGIQVRSEAEFAIAQQIADTFYVVGTLP